MRSVARRISPPVAQVKAQEIGEQIANGYSANKASAMLDIGFYFSLDSNFEFSQSVAFIINVLWFKISI